MKEQIDFDPIWEVQILPYDHSFKNYHSIPTER